MSRRLNFIVKVQRSVYTSEVQPQVLIYNRARDVMCQEPFERYNGPPMKLGEFKLYCWAHLEDRQLVLGRRAPDQDW